ncbi:MAG: four helix bundle protein [Elusimicrobia bacterium]|nr:four helix bundle protein [Candidatus Obscuribacterium magneticum]
MNDTSHPRKYDLEERTFKFAQDVRLFLQSYVAPLSNTEDKKQLLRSSGSVAANYIEANESLSGKDFVMRIKICRKEAKESYLWLRLMQNGPGGKSQAGVNELLQEALELTRIFNAIARKCEKNERGNHKAGNPPLSLKIDA